MDIANGLGIAPNLRPLLVLEVLSNSNQAMTATEINRSLGLPKQTIHRLCMRLLREGFLVNEASGKRLRPSRRLKMMASGILNNAPVHISRHQILLELADQIGETVNFVVAEKLGMTYRDRVETRWPLRIQLPIGSHVPFHCTASGKTYLASLQPKLRQAMVESLTLEKLTPKTHDQPDNLMGELARAAKDGFAVDDEEFMQGMVAIAVPVLDPADRYIGALAFHGPTQRLSIAAAKEKLDILRNGAVRLRDAIMA